jgi:hypothetical protein
VGLQKNRTNIAKKKGLLAVKMRDGWNPAIESRPLFEKEGDRPIPRSFDDR